MCECSSTSCTGSIRLTRAEYRDAWRAPNRFLVLPGHQLPDIERVVEKHESSFVVEKVPPAGKDS